VAFRTAGTGKMCSVIEGWIPVSPALQKEVHSGNSSGRCSRQIVKSTDLFFIKNIAVMLNKKGGPYGRLPD
jgi:hypothetical protein